MSKRAEFAWRACWDWQIELFNAGDLAIGEPTSEMTGNARLAEQPCLRFTRNSDLLPAFMSTRQGGAILRVDLAELDPEQWQEWPQTLDIHVHAQAVLDHAQIVEVPHND